MKPKLLHAFRNAGQLCKTSFKEWNQKDPFRQSAVIAYYAIFSMPGLLVLIITITGYFFDKDAVNQSILTQITQILGTNTANEVKSMLVLASQSKATFLGSIIGAVVILVGATGVFVELQKTLNIIWKVEVVSHKGIWFFIKNRLFSFGLILAIAFLLLISLVVTTALSAMSDWITADASNIVAKGLTIFNFIFSLATVSFLFALMFKILPDAKIKWKNVWLGALITGVLFTIGKTALALYFSKANPASVYGAAGSIVLILLWVSYSSMIVFFGAEFTAAHSLMRSGNAGATMSTKTSGK